MLLLGMGITLKSDQKKDFKKKTTGGKTEKVFFLPASLVPRFFWRVSSFLRRPRAAQNPETVLELFTSQGCSSCPPADRLAARLAREENLLILSFAVNYWDYLGWKDTLASPITTRRQKAYARAMGNWGAVYTPQMVVNGRKHVVASRPQKVRALMARLKKTPANRIPIHIRAEESALRIAIGAAAANHESPKRHHLAHSLCFSRTCLRPLAAKMRGANFSTRMLPKPSQPLACGRAMRLIWIIR